MSQQNEWNDIVEEIRLFLPRLIQASTETGDMLYDTLTEQVWLQFGEVVEGIDDLYRTLILLQADVEGEAVRTALQPVIAWGIKAISEAFGILNGYMDEESYGLAGDCIHHELIPIFMQLATELGDLTSEQEKRFQANLLYLKRRYPRVYAQVEGITFDQNRYHIVHSKNGMANLCLVTAEYHSTYFHSRYNPAEEARQWVSQWEDNVAGKSNILMYGLGMGHVLRCYAEVYPQHQIYLYEPDVQVLIAIMKGIRLDELFANIQIADFVVGTDSKLKEEFIVHFSRQVGGPEMVAMPFYAKHDRQTVIDFLTLVKETVTYNGYYIHNYKEFGLSWVRNSMLNAAAVLSTPSINGLKARFANMAAVVVGAGPSLEQDIDILKKMKKHAIIIAAGSTIQSLQHFGVEPHLIVSIDGSDYNYKAFQSRDTRNVPLLFAPMIHHQIIEETSSTKLHAFLAGDSTMKFIMEGMEEDHIFKSTYSVTGTAIQAAIYMGCTEIIFIGQDLSYTDERIYAAGAQQFSGEEIESFLNEAELHVENVHGGMNRTDRPMLVTLRDIERLIALYPDKQFINTSKSGARIEHTSWEPLEKILFRLRHCEVADDIINAALNDVPLYSQDRITKVAERIESIQLQLPEFIRELKRLQQHIAQLPALGRSNPSKCSKLIATIDAGWEEITTGTVFLGIYLRACGAELEQFRGALPKLAEARTLLEQIAFYQDAMQMVVGAFLDKYPDVEVIVEETVRRVRSITVMAIT